MWFLLLLAAAAAFVLLIVWVGLRKRRRKRAQIAKRAWAQWAELPKIADASRRVLEAENILDRVLRDIGYQGTFGEKLKTMQKTLPNIDAVWHAHKLRNRIAHEPGMHIGSTEATTALVAIEKALKNFFPMQSSEPSGSSADRHGSNLSGQRGLDGSERKF